MRGDIGAAAVRARGTHLHMPRVRRVCVRRGCVPRGARSVQAIKRTACTEQLVGKRVRLVTHNMVFSQNIFSLFNLQPDQQLPGLGTHELFGLFP
jgi:hypothetical protein